MSDKMESDTSENKKISLEEMSKEDIIKKYNNFLMIAKKAKNSKNGISIIKLEQHLSPIPLQMATEEALEELKKAKEKESKLISEVNALKEIIESFMEDKKRFAEFDSRIKHSEEQNINLKSCLQKLEDQYASKIIECTKLEETLGNMSKNLASLEENYSEAMEKLEDFKENYAKIDIQKKLLEEKVLAYEKTKSNPKHEEHIVESSKIADELKQKEKEVNELNRKCEEFSEKLKNIPENWTDVINDNKKLKKYLSDAEESKLKLTDELNYFRKCFADFDEKSKDYAKLSEKLIKEERENLKLIEEISELKRSSSERIEENERRLRIMQEEKENIRESLNEDLKLLKEQLKKEKDEKEKLLHALNEQEEMKLCHQEESDIKNEKLELELKKAVKKEQNLKAEKDNLNKQIDEMQREWDEKLQGEKNANFKLMTEKEELQKQLQEKVIQIASKSKEWEENVIKKKEQIQSKDEEILKLKQELDRSKEILKELDEKKNNEAMQEERDSWKRELEMKREHYEKSIDSITWKSKEILDSLVALKELKKDFKNELKNKLKCFETEQNEVRQRIEEVVLTYVSQLHNGNSELLSEMNIMNQALKERGENISKLEQLVENQRKELEESSVKISDQSSKLQEKNKKLNELEEELVKVKQEVEIKHKTMREMEEEMWRMKNNDSQGEALSSSTLSRAEESARLMELEESFEERYSKLKVIAVKLKKKAGELQKQVEIERNRLINAETDYQNKITGFHNQIKSLRNIQTEYDTLQDVLDEERKEKNALKKSLDSIQKEMTLLKHELEVVRSDKEKYKIDKTSLEKIKKEFAAHIGELKQTIEKQKVECNQLEKQIEEMRNELALKDKHIEKEKEKHKHAMRLLEEQKQDSKKHSVLELEMAAYEKTAEDLKKKLDDKANEVRDLKDILEGERKLLKSKEEEISRLKSTISDGHLETDCLSTQVKQLNEELIIQKAEMEKKIEIIRTLEKNTEEKNLRIENLSLELEEIMKEKLKAEEKYRTGEEKLCRQIHNLEDKISTLENVLGQREMELEEVKNEYQAYKVRAQSVLRQSQKEINPSKQQNVLEELEQMKSTSESLKTKYEELRIKLQKMAEENKMLLDEKKRLFERIQELNNIVFELRDENQLLKEMKQKENEEHAEAIRMQKLHSDTLVQCFQKQIEELETKHMRQFEELKKEMEQVQKPNQIFLLPEIKRSDRREVQDQRKISNSFIPVKPEKEVLDVMLLEREECEGSESVDSTSPQTGNNNLLPLDQLLYNADHCEPPKKCNHDVTYLKNLLEKSENRIKHLTVLLAEAESDSARLNQLNEVLKEEIRRLQRSLEREKHAQNFEYLKNVILKFVSLQNVDERLRLVPVLNTILKLSPEEEHTLMNCAKGIFENGSRSWGNYLSIWPTA